MKRIFTVTGAVLGLLIGLAFVLPAVAKWQALGRLPGMDQSLLLLGSALMLGSLAMVVRQIISRTH